MNELERIRDLALAIKGFSENRSICSMAEEIQMQVDILEEQLFPPITVHLSSPENVFPNVIKEIIRRSLIESMRKKHG